MPAADPVAAAPGPVEVAPAPVAEPVVAPVADAAPVAAPVAEPVAEVEAPSATSLLSDAQPEPAPEPPLTYEGLKWPGDVAPEGEAFKPYAEVFGKHKVSQEAVQEIIELYAGQQQRQVEALRSQYDEVRAGWVDQFKNDPEIGKNRSDTTLMRAAEIRDRFGGTKAQVQELKDVLGMTGAGDHPAVIRLLNNVAKALGEGRPATPVQAKAPPGQKNGALSRYPSMQAGQR